ncbi:hypothetical protein CDCA_CDCA02G0731 [Cyanidium caldarium]|uniref:Uncharacterized protein n=1 Tax=Cyanidium caldarium TaxID=2771 RepID=A0AAV9IRJ9_CYACA|nr:hypothetical protein CDCA_CDCA02G0731 [Cyanidium caldarium]
MAEFHDQSGREWLLEFDSYGNTYYRPARSFSGSFCAHNYLRNTVDYLSNMMLAPNETMTIIAGPHPRFKSIRREFTFQLEPCRFAQRIMAARESVARELRTDLALIPAENNEILSERLDEQAGHKHVAQRVLDHDENTSDASPLRYQNYQLMKALLTRRAVERFLGRLRFEGRHIEYDWLKLWPDWDTQVQNGDDLVKALLRLGSVTCIGRECVIEGNDRRVVRDGVGLHSEARHEFWPRDFVDELLLLRARIANEWMAHLTPEAIKEEHLQIMRAHLKRTTPDT